MKHGQRRLRRSKAALALEEVVEAARLLPPLLAEVRVPPRIARFLREGAALAEATEAKAAATAVSATTTVARAVLPAPLTLTFDEKRRLTNSQARHTGSDSPNSPEQSRAPSLQRAAPAGTRWVMTRNR